MIEKTNLEDDIRPIDEISCRSYQSSKFNIYDNDPSTYIKIGDSFEFTKTHQARDLVPLGG